jgi:hypothetical protein
MNNENQKSKTMEFYHEGELKSGKMKVYNDAFYEITEGEYKGSLVHTFNVRKGGVSI